MKIASIYIKDHNQFKDLKLDLTYPKGHKKEGQALDKVCLIGQSGTGKTTLLEEIWGNKLRHVKSLSLLNYRTTPFVNDISFSYDPFFLPKTVSSTVYFNINSASLPHNEKERQHLQKYNSYLFSLLLEDSGWAHIQEKVKKHQEEKAKYAFAISKAFQNKDLDLAEDFSQKLKQWEQENETPLSDLAESYLNPILKEFNLEVKTELESLEEVNQIHLINKQLETIPYKFWSSGIKNIIARTIPLYTHKFEYGVICIDEPENSLYPDIQKKIIQLYTELAPNNQFFFATHSPIIASNFEPWEIVELKFNKEGFVYREQYWEGENHVDNYKYYPQYLRWDAILQNIFDLEDDGSDDRKLLLEKFTNLDNKLKERKRNGEQLSKEDPEVKELMEMGKKLGWDTQKER